jgi:hypothetical protein
LAASVAASEAQPAVMPQRLIVRVSTNAFTGISGN